jgi:hypothetical protein
MTLNLRQGNANSHDAVDFATTLVHDPADYSFLGSEPTPLEKHISHITSPDHHNKPPPLAPPPSPCPSPLLKYDLNFVSKKWVHIQWFKSLTPEETTLPENLFCYKCGQPGHKRSTCPTKHCLTKRYLPRKHEGNREGQ